MQTSVPVQAQLRAEPHPGVTGWSVTLHSFAVQAAAGWQHVRLLAIVSHTSDPVHSSQIAVGGGVSVLQESGTAMHWPAGTAPHVVLVQHVPGVPGGGATPGAPVALSTHTWSTPHATLMSLFPHPSGSPVPHCPA